MLYNSLKDMKYKVSNHTKWTFQICLR